MNAIDILRRVTKPKTDAQAMEALVKRYGSSVRENVSSDDPAALFRATMLSEKYIARPPVSACNVTPQTLTGPQ